MKPSKKGSEEAARAVYLVMTGELTLTEAARFVGVSLPTMSTWLAGLPWKQARKNRVKLIWARKRMPKAP